MTYEEMLASPPPSFSWPAGGIDGNGAPGLAVIGLTWGPQLEIFVGEDESSSPVFPAETPAHPGACAVVVLPPTPVVRSATPRFPVVAARAQPVLSPPPARAAVVVKRR